MILSLINDGNTTLNVRSERTRQGRIPCKSNLFWENDIAKSALSFIRNLLCLLYQMECAHYKCKLLLLLLLLCKY